MVGCVMPDVEFRPKKEADLPSHFVEYVKRITAARPAVVIAELLAHGTVTTERIRQLGYNHEPRAVQDVKDNGVPIDKRTVESSNGRRISEYSFGDPAQLNPLKFGGRNGSLARLKQPLLDLQNSRCSLCNGTFSPSQLQVDHRVPFLICGFADVQFEIDSFMLLCRSCNRTKSWACEHCPNRDAMNSDDCRRCYWYGGDDYDHVALVPIRRLDILWEGQKQVAEFEEAKHEAESRRMELRDFVKLCVSDRLG